MLDRQKVILAFEEKRNQFHDYAVDLGRQSEMVQEILAEFGRQNPDEILRALEQRSIQWPGALPTPELAVSELLRMPFHHTWQNHREARSWANRILQGRPVIAVDGSQISPTKDFSTPIGAVQIGWFVNYHQPGGRYEKDVDFQLIGPEELASAEDDSESANGGLQDWLVNQMRFVGECQRLCKLMTEHADVPDARKPVCFLDGSFIISFAGQMRPYRAQAYIDAVCELLTCSERYGVPLVAYVDTSFSHDLISLIHTLFPSKRSTTLSDAGLLARSLTKWGDRSPFFICAREDALSKDGRADYYRNVAFTYLRTVSDRPPVRVEMPRWLVESGKAEEVMDVVRAQCVVGAGYPYALETADATAVITMQDRQRFYALLQQFLEREGISLTMARKVSSKMGRR